MKTIISSAEVVKHGGATRSMQAYEQIICDHLAIVENQFMVDCFGYDYYQLLLADVVDYSAVAEFDPAVVYADLTKVRYNGIVYVLDLDGQTYVEEIVPDCNKQWNEADKFNTACYNSLYKDGWLQKVLAVSVLYTVIPFVVAAMKSGGYEEIADTAIEQMKLHQQSIDTQMKRLIGLMKDWVTRQIDIGVCDFSEIAFVASECGVVGCEPQQNGGFAVAWPHD